MEGHKAELEHVLEQFKEDHPEVSVDDVMALCGSSSRYATSKTRSDMEHLFSSEVRAVSSGSDHPSVRTIVKEEYEEEYRERHGRL